MKVIAFLAFFFALSCQSTPSKTSNTYSPVMKSEVGRIHVTRYYSHSSIVTIEDMQKTRDKTEILDFSVESKGRSANPDGTFEVDVKTIRKDGTASLHELAFPELNETISFALTRQGKILRAGEYPKHSLFFVPFVPLPKSEVEVGETWTLTHTWVSEPSQIPLTLDLVAILKATTPCLKGDTCLDIEINGKVLLEASTRDDVRFDGKVWGRLLFSLGRGDVVWSETRSTEEMLIGKSGMAVKSCMVSQVQDTSPTKKDGFGCKPSRDPIERVPKI